MLSFKIKLIIVLISFGLLGMTAFMVGCKCDVTISEMSDASQAVSPMNKLKKYINGKVNHFTPSKLINKASARQHRLLGHWSGPEGTYLEVVQQGKGYQVLIQDLETLRIFDASAEAETIVFERDGTRQTIRASNGDDTGMKWLSGKSDCVTIILGEGYCRD